jgi:CheY-like chemotaxis protein
MYSRVKNLDEKIKSLSLTYMEWKVLFLVTENTPLRELKELLKEDEEVLTLALETLKSKALIESAEAAKPAEEKAAKTKPKAEAPPPPVEEELVTTELSEIEDALQEQTEVQVSKTIKERETTPTVIREEPESFEILETEKELETTPAEEKAGIDDLLHEISEAPEMPPQRGKEPAVAEVQKEKVTEPVISRKAPVAEVVGESTKKKIMVIDDSIVIRKMVEIALEGEDYLIQTATNAKDGIEGIEKNNPNLIILDMILPDMNGIDVLKKIKSSRKTPVIMLSGKDAPQLVESAKEMGVDDFLPKPFRDEELVEKVKYLLSQISG